MKPNFKSKGKEVYVDDRFKKSAIFAMIFRKTETERNISVLPDKVNEKYS